MAEILKMENICKSYYMDAEELEVLHNVNLTVDSGEFLSILGPSGSGKSTMMNIIGCLDTATSGTYLLSGNDINKLDEIQLARVRNREIGFVFQSFHLLPRLTALQNVELPLIYSGLAKAQRQKRAGDILERVGLADKLRNLPNQLSGGQQQRVAIARALVTEPTILLADEPTGALDQKTGLQVMELFEEINRDHKTIIMITHDTGIARRARRVVNILDGHLSEAGYES
ncbi:macrolide export ATP-binding/permease protein MacB [Ruminiclostridium hungatei]|uniref:Macrolide export ATP-binding/permease protein MacB n=1 Tax=Ruminiclostridium hungatei TaxID=48256 RepID=A0A1V4SKY0_RUMHU|nr:ABC transporter ATP-binding protein [Ruminiclostridium hungatei]OPX44443.1 macrolide export ATP-binding/permease protein MacB [Ruminiclostridium hungatei]